MFRPGAGDIPEFCEPRRRMIGFDGPETVAVSERGTYGCVAGPTIRTLRTCPSEMAFNNMWFDDLQIRVVVV